MPIGSARGCIQRLILIHQFPPLFHLNWSYNPLKHHRLHHQALLLFTLLACLSHSITSLFKEKVIWENIDNAIFSVITTSFFCLILTNFKMLWIYSHYLLKEWRWMKRFQFDTFQAKWEISANLLSGNPQKLIVHITVMSSFRS